MNDNYRKKISRNHKFITLFLAGIGIIIGILYFIGIKDILYEASKLRIEYLAILLLIEFTILFVWAFKWKIILRESDVFFKNIFSTYLLGILMNNLTPVGIAGGEPFRAYVLSKVDKISIEKSFASVTTDLFLCIPPIFVISIVAIFFVFSYGMSSNIALLLVMISFLLFITFLVTMAIFLNKNFSMKIIKLFLGITSKIPFLKSRATNAYSRIDHILDEFHETIMENMRDKYILTVGTLLSGLAWFLTLFRTYVLFKMLNIPISFPEVIIVQITVITVSFLPVLPGALGVWEGTSIALYTGLGISPASAAAATIIDRFIGFWIPAVFGVIATIHLGVNIIKIRDEDMVHNPKN